MKDRTEKHLADVRAKISDHQRIEKVLAATAAQCSGKDVPEGPVLEALASELHPAIHFATPGSAKGECA
ncbi:MAG: hypothetical protein Q8K28_01625 [Hoeflea sp.]|uniref:hypothetical protein n=1 Tax=Hoeflea sp. TaxID=1940281 RepID=UPI00273156A7|nr:hypothetical protein [Hoeflea sp.]MDP2118580.1 hypothetical protein [Hoeflea sp.]